MANLNDVQQKAVTHGPGNLLIVAGPGTGKTHTLTHRILKLTEQLKSTEKILAVTFTNKAAHEMRQRLEKLGVDLKCVFVGTFHQFCLSLLREFIEETELPRNFRVVEPQDIEGMAKLLWPDLSKREQTKILEDIGRQKSSMGGLLDKEKYLNQYNQQLRQNGWLDFDDLLLETIRLLEMKHHITMHIRSLYTSIFVDEYQDINSVQHHLLKILAGPQGHITAIGDPNQAIYGFRGGSHGFFKTFSEDFPNTTVLSLTQNYRSTSNILEASSQVITGHDVTISPLTAEIYEKGKLIIHETPTEKAEAEYVVHQIEKIIGGTSLFSQDSGRVSSQAQAEFTFGDIAILYRLNAQRKCLEEALERSGIPYQVSGREPYPVEEPWVYDVEKVHLSTIHAAKGLEFAVVFILGCEDNLLPLNLEGLISNPQEERRLFYVAMTRAKNQLFLTRVRKRVLFGKFYENVPSPFLKDIEERLKEYEQIKQRRGQFEKQMSFLK